MFSIVLVHLGHGVGRLTEGVHRASDSVLAPNDNSPWHVRFYCVSDG